MTDSEDLLIEIGSEELPPRALPGLSQSLAEGLRAGLEAAGLDYQGVQPYATPRRLALLVTGLARVQRAREVVRRGPPLASAYDAEGRPTAAALGFARSCGVRVEDLERLVTDKGGWLGYRAREGGRAAAELLPAILAEALAALRVPKRMRWGDGQVEFVRPVHWVVLLFGGQVLEAEILGVRADRYTRGHRFHHPDPIRLEHPRDYLPALSGRGRVIPDLAARQARLCEQIEALAAAQGGRAVVEPSLLEEVTALTEWPVALCGGFDPAFLALPEEVLIATMQDKQRCFPVRDAQGRLLPRFIAVANLESRDPGVVRRGLERVIRPRLADAEFFWRQDRSCPLAARLGALKDMVFHEQLGSLLEKTERLMGLAAELAAMIGAEVEGARRAALLSRCDLASQMVGEFPELQGAMGRYYALHDGEPEEVAMAIDEMYLPRFAGDALPQRKTGQALALADRLDTLAGLFGVGEAPTGEKDPFGLRRAALGVLRIILEQRLDLDLEAVIHLAASRYGERFDQAALTARVFDFMMERLRWHYLEAGVPADAFEAVLAVRPTRPLDFASRLRAVCAFRRLPAAASLAAAHKRIANLLRKAEGDVPEAPVDPQRLTEAAERRLYGRLRATASAVEPLLASRDYAEVLAHLAELREDVDAFFDSVLVLCEEEGLRTNRLALLGVLRALFLRVADISRLQLEASGRNGRRGNGNARAPQGAQR